MIEKFTVSRDDSIYHAWPDVALTPSGRLVCVFSECTHHGDRSYTRIMHCHSDDRGTTWSPKRPLAPAARFTEGKFEWWNCPRISTLSDGRLVALVDYCQNSKPGEAPSSFQARIEHLYFTRDGESWSDGPATPARGIVPDQIVELKSPAHHGRWIFVTHHRTGEDFSLWQVEAWISDDQGQTWRDPVVVAAAPQLRLCEGSVVELPGGELICFLRENSSLGLDAYKCISRDGGLTWSAPVAFPLPACHRPVAGMLQSGKVMIVHRFMQGGKGWIGWWTQNTFAALTDIESCLAEKRNDAHARILPLDFDRSGHCDTGYTGWVQFPDGQIVIVNYIVDDAPKAQIRAYRLDERDFLLPGS